MTRGRDHGKALASFEECAWFDGFLSPEYCFVATCTIKLRRTYKDRIAQAKREANKCFSGLFDDSKNSFNALCALKLILPELHEIAEFGSVVGNDKLLPMSNPL